MTTAVRGQSERARILATRGIVTRVRTEVTGQATDPRTCYNLNTRRASRMTRRCKQCGQYVPPEASACGYCGCTESRGESLSPTLARKIIAGALLAGATGLTNAACSFQSKYGAPCDDDDCPYYTYDAATDAGEAEAAAGDADADADDSDTGIEAGDSDAADAAPE
jgi:hypothetical protein